VNRPISYSDHIPHLSGNSSTSIVSKNSDKKSHLLNLNDIKSENKVPYKLTPELHSKEICSVDIKGSQDKR
jgi:hypothetical protein